MTGRLIDADKAVNALADYITEPNISDDESEIKGFNSGIETAIAEIGQNCPAVEAIPVEYIKDEIWEYEANGLRDDAQAVRAMLERWLEENGKE